MSAPNGDVQIDAGRVAQRLSHQLADANLRIAQLEVALAMVVESKNQEDASAKDAEA